MQKEYIPGIGRGIMLVLATVIAAHALRYYAALENVWLGIDPNIKAVILRVPLQALTHMLIALAALILGPLQFFPGLRARHPKLHRWSGRIYVLACVIGGAAALATSPSASGGSVAGLGFGTLAILWIGTTAAAWISAVQRKARVASATHAIRLRDVLRSRRPSPADSDRLSAGVRQLFRHVSHFGVYFVDTQRLDRRPFFDVGGAVALSSMKPSRTREKGSCVCLPRKPVRSHSFKDRSQHLSFQTYIRKPAAAKRS
jgi:Predicted membrane protein (DUF2306)